MDTMQKAAELATLTTKQLARIIEKDGLDIIINKSKTKQKIVKEMLGVYAARDVDAAKASQGAEKGDALRPVNPALENLQTPESALGENQTPAQEDEPYVERRGGARPGAGRPAGMTAEKARMAQLSECPHPVVLAAVELLFDGWASAVGCEAVALTKDEAKDLALPWTNVLEYMGVAQKIPVWAELAITCTWNTINTLKMKAKIAREFAKNRKPVESKVVTDGTTDRA